MTNKEIIKRYEEESWNTVKDGLVYDSCGQYICKFTKTLAKNYHKNVEDAEDSTLPKPTNLVGKDYWGNAPGNKSKKSKKISYKDK